MLNFKLMLMVISLTSAVDEPHEITKEFPAKSVEDCASYIPAVVVEYDKTHPESKVVGAACIAPPEILKEKRNGS